jgi:sec-independent protein translocase protein TatA
MTDLAIVVFVAVLVFAATRIPSLGDALGRAFKKGQTRASDAAPPRHDDGPRARPPAAS